MGAEDPFCSGRILIVAAHPDDETIAAGAQLPDWCTRVQIFHVTNGAPDNNQDYASARRRELLSAVGLAGIGPEQCQELGFIDQHASFDLPGMTQRVSAVIERLRPAVVLTHPYEGGHPDHDSCAFAVEAALRMLVDPRIQRWEFPSYHMGFEGAMETGRFLASPARLREVRYNLTGQQQTLKRKMFDCFATQQHVLSEFNTEAELFRAAPEYDFTQPPHPGRLYYEQFDWGVTGLGWRQLAGEALIKLGLEYHATHSS